MSKHEAVGKSDEWYTPKYIFDALGCEFDMDVSAPFDIDQIHTPCKYYINANSLDLEWHGFVWMNPPFGGRNGLVPWLNKIYKHGNGVALTPDRTSAPWWQDTAMKADAHLQIDGKVRFISGNGSNNAQPSTGTTLFAFGSKGVEALIRAESKGLGIVFNRMRQLQYEIQIPNDQSVILYGIGS